MAHSNPESAPGTPALHLAPPRGWMNDPNGLSFVDGRWHAYYQHNPHDDVWGDIHWRHATSPDLLQWTDHGLALAPDELGQVFSGSVVVDHADTAGFGAGARVAVFTLAGPAGQQQGIAWSPDGHTWTMHHGNPVLADPAEADFRDPKVVPFEGGWLMALAVGKEIRFYRSPDLKTWDLAGSHRPGTPVVGAVECAEVTPIATVAGEAGWCLVYCDDKGSPDGRSQALAAAGSFDGSSFQEWGPPTHLDAGPDFYAPQSFSGVDPARGPIVLGWMNNWSYARTHPSSGWRGVLSLPRRLSVASMADPKVRSGLAVPLDDAFPLVGASPWPATPGRAVAVTGVSFQARLCSAVGGAIDVTADGDTVRLVRDDIGLDGFAIAAEVSAGGLPVTVVFDQGTVEVFTDAGTTISALAFAGPEWVVETSGPVQLRHSGGVAAQEL